MSKAPVKRPVRGRPPTIGVPKVIARAKPVLTIRSFARDLEGRQYTVMDMLLRRDADYMVDYLYSKLANDGPTRTIKYQHQQVGAVVCRINQKLAKAKLPFTIKPGDRRRSYRLYQIKRKS